MKRVNAQVSLAFSELPLPLTFLFLEYFEANPASYHFSVHL